MTREEIGYLLLGIAIVILALTCPWIQLLPSESIFAAVPFSVLGAWLILPEEHHG